MTNSESSKISLYIKSDFKHSLKIKAAKDNVSISKVAGHFLRNWNLGVMGFVGYEDRFSLPSISGVYFVISDDTVRYIGRSVDMKRRFGKASHHKHGVFENLNTPVVIHWIAIDNSELEELENLLIEIIEPELNDIHSNQTSGKYLSSNQTTIKLWADTLEIVRQIKEITLETQVLILHRLATAELEKLKDDNRRQVRR